MDSISVTVTVTDAEDTPTFTSLEAVSVAENQVSTSYTAIATNPGLGTLVFSLSGGADQAAFNIDETSGALSFEVASDFENPVDADTNNEYLVDIDVSDGLGGSDSLSLTVTVTDAPEAPVFTSVTSVDVAEGQTDTGYTATATDEEGDDLTFSLSGGADQAAFSIDGASGVLSFAAALDFENPADANTDNEYLVQLSVSDGNEGVDTLSLAVSVTNVAEPPVLTSGTTSSAPENQTETGYTATATGEEGADLSFSLIGGADQADFSIDPDSGVLSFAVAPDFENPADENTDNDYVVEVSVSAGDAGSDSQTVTVSVTDEALLSVEVSYPTDGAELGGASQITVTGNVIDSEDGVVSNDDVQSLFVNDGMVTFEIDDPSRWSINEVAIIEGVNTIDVSLLPAVGDDEINVSQSVFSTTLTSLLEGPVGVVLDTTMNRAFVIDPVSDALIAIDLDNDGAQSLISDANMGDGQSFASPNDLELLDPNTALVIDSNLDALLSVDLTTGDRAVISQIAATAPEGMEVGTGPDFDNPRSVVLDPDEVANRVLVTDVGLGAVLAVDLTSGDRTTVSDDSDFELTEFGTGDAFQTPQEISFANATTLVVIDNGLDALFSVDIPTGDRTIISAMGTGTGMGFNNPQDVVVDGTTYYIADNGSDAIVSVIGMGAGMGNRTIFSDDTTGTGDVFDAPVDLALDTANDRVLVIDSGNADLVSVDLTDGETFGNRTRLTVEEELSAGTGPSFNNPRDIALDTDQSRLLVADAGQDALLAMDFSGTRTIISDNTDAGEPFVAPRSVVLDSANNRALVIDNALDALFEIDLSDGSRSILSQGTTGAATNTVAATDETGSGTEFNNPQDFVISADGTSIYVIDTSIDALLKVDLASGDREIVSQGEIAAGAGNSTGTGPDFDAPQYLVLDEANDRILVVDTGNTVNALFSVNLTDGTRAIISQGETAAGVGNNTGTGSDFSNPQAVALSPDGSMALVVDTNDVILVDLLNGGNREIISSDAIGAGPSITGGQGLVIDADNNRAFVSDTAEGAVFVIELDTGDRALSSK